MSSHFTEDIVFTFDLRCLFPGCKIRRKKLESKINNDFQDMFKENDYIPRNFSGFIQLLRDVLTIFWLK